MKHKTKVQNELSENDIIRMAINSASSQYDESQFTVFGGYGSSAEYSLFLCLGKMIADDSYQAFEIENRDSGCTISTTLIGKILTMLKNAETNYHHRYSCIDYVAIPLEELEKMQGDGLRLMDVDLACNNRELAEAFNELISRSRKRLRSHKVQERIENRKKNAYRNYLSAIQYIDGLFDIHARMTVVRLDIGYRRFGDGSMVSLEQAVNDFKSLQASMKMSGTFEHCLGYLQRMELGVGNEEFELHKGYHFHLFYFFDGNKINGDVSKAQEIGEFWRDVVTSGQGIFHNCNKDKEIKYGNKNGIGKVHFADSKKRDNLKRAIGYITKASQFLAVKDKPGMRTFSRGQLPRKTSNAGRPRSVLSIA